MENFLKKYSLLFIVIILALAVFFRLYQLKNIPPGLYPDEAMNGNNALEAIETGQYKVFYPENNGREGLFINLQSLSLRIFGNEPWVLRIVSVILGTLTVLGLYLLTKELFKRESIALLASFFLATSFWHINFSRIGFRAIMAPFFLVWGLWLIWLVLRKPNIFLALIAGLTLGLGFYSYISYRLAPVLCLIPLWILLKNKKFLATIIFAIGVIIAVYPLLNYFYHYPADFFGRTTQISIFTLSSPATEFIKNILKTVGMFFFAGDFNWRHNISGSPELWWPISILFLIGIVVSLKRRILADWFLIGWMVFMLLPVVISAEGIPHALRSIVVVPVAMIFAALGLNWLAEKIDQWLEDKTRLKKELIVLLFAFLLVISINTYTQYFIKWAKSPEVALAFNENYYQLGNYLRYSPPDIKKYVIINAQGIDVRGFPMSSQTVMFLTDTFLPERQKQKNIFYLNQKDLDGFIETVKKEENFQIFMLERDTFLRKKLLDNIPGLFTYENAGILIQQK